MIDLLVEYPPALGHRVLHHIALHNNFLPSLAEVAGPLREAKAEMIRARLEEDKRRKLLPARGDATPGGAPRPSIEELKARYGKTWGLRVVK